MAQFKRLKSDVPYTPLAAWNPDGNGLQLRPEECAHTKNLRFFQKDVATRGGTSVLAFNTPSTDPILHVHNYKAPDGKEKLFGFTKSGIYLYDSVSQYWKEAWQNAGAYSIPITWPGLWTTVAKSKQEPSYTSEYVSGDTENPTPISGEYWAAPWLASLTSPSHFDSGCYFGLEYVYPEIQDFSVYDYLLFTYKSNYNNIYNVPVVSVAPFVCRFSVIFYDETDLILGTLASDTITITSKGISSRSDVLSNFNSAKPWSLLKLEDVSSLTAVKYFRVLFEVLSGELYENDCGQNMLIVDSLKFNSNLVSSPVSHWHTTDFIDNAKGSTVVACGSIPPAPGGEETDALSRVMYYYDPSDGVFKELEQKHQMIVSNEVTTKKTPSSTQTVTSAAGLSAFATAGRTLVPGTFVLGTAEHGLLATSSTIEGTFGGKAGYALVPVGTKVVAGLSSYVLKDGSAWSVVINGTEQTKDVYIILGYDYKETSAYKPRFAWVLNNRLVMANTYEDGRYQPWRVRWSAIADIFQVRDIDYADLIDTDVTPIVGGDYQATNLIIYKTGSIVKCRYAGESLVYSFETVFLSGSFAGKTIKTYNHKQFFLGTDDVYLWDGATAVSITIDPQRGNYRVRDKIFSILNNDRVHYCMANIYPKYQEYWLWIVRTGETYPSSAFIYNMIRGVWFYFEFEPCTCVGLYTKRTSGTSSSRTYDELVGTYDEQNWTFEGGYLAGTVQYPILAYQSGNVYIVDDMLVSDGSYVDNSGTFVSGTLIPIEFITRDFTLGDISYQKRFNRLNFEATGTEVTVGHLGYQSQDVSEFLYKTTIPLDNTNEERHYFPDFVNETIRFSFEASGFFSLRWMQPQGIELDYENE